MNVRMTVNAHARLVCMLGLATLLAFLAGCGVAGYGAPASSGNGSSASGAGSAATGASIVSTASARVSGHAERVLTDGQGYTLYYFDDDSSTTSACTVGCSSTWPPLLVSSGTPTSTSSLPGSLSAADVGNGQQVLYNGHPLYRYSGDTASGQTHGEGIDGKWHVATPDVTVNAGGAGAQATPTVCSGPYCY